MKIIVYVISLFGVANCLTCISNESGHVTCSNTDYCVYFSGDSDGSQFLFQGCSAKLSAESDVTVCDANEYSQGTTPDGEKYILQCCSTTNCNTGKQSSSGSNRLTCLTTSGDHETCTSGDRYCAYLSGTYQGTKTLFQGCSAKLTQQTGVTACTGNEFTHGTTDDDTYTLQCCDTNNCNTGKDGNNGNNEAARTYSVFSLTIIFIYLCVYMPF